ncbi:hypothetical protein FPOAC2_08444 [Fusarium poae]|jgi:hypothetical protein
MPGESRIVCLDLSLLVSHHAPLSACIPDIALLKMHQCETQLQALFFRASHQRAGRSSWCPLLKEMGDTGDRPKHVMVGVGVPSRSTCEGYVCGGKEWCY